MIWVGPIQPGVKQFQGWIVTTSLGNVFLLLTTLTENNFFLISNTNLPSFSLKPFLFDLSLHVLEKNPLQLSYRLSLCTGRCYKVSTELSVPQTVQVLSSCLQRKGSPALRKILVFSGSAQRGQCHSLGTPEMDAALQQGSQQSRTKGQNPLPQSAGQCCWM